MNTFHGPSANSELAIGTLTLPGLLASVAERHASHPALVYYDSEDRVIRWTYRDLELEARRVAKALLAIGLPKGARVALLMGNRPEWVAAAFGATMVGGVLTPLDTFCEPPALEYTLRHCDASVLLMQRQLLRHVYLEQLGALCPEALRAKPGHIRSARFPFLRRVVCLHPENGAGAVEPWDRFLARGEDVPETLVDACAREVSPADDALIIYTSGTTATPKGILHSHRAPALQSWRFARLYGLDSEIRVWSPSPFFWTAGFAMVIGGTLAAGGCLVLQEHFDPGQALLLLEKERVTTTYAWPHQLVRLEEHPHWQKRDLSALRHVDPSSGFARQGSVRAQPEWKANGYGMSETFTLVSALPAETPSRVLDQCYGEILPGNVVRILDLDTGKPLGPGSAGEIAVKGPTLMKGYVKLPPEQCFDEDGFFRTGDAGHVDDEGYLHWTGRIQRLIKTGGANVSPVEVENAAMGHPGLKTALAVGVPHPTLGEMVVLCVVPREGASVDEENIRQFLSEQLASYKIPRRALFFREEEFPETGSAKIQAERVRALALSKLAEINGLSVRERL